MELYADRVERREKLQIYGDVLAVCIRDRRTSEILHEANLFAQSWDEYRPALIAKGLLMSYTDSNGATHYRSTAHGRKMLKTIRDIYDVIGVE